MRLFRYFKPKWGIDTLRNRRLKATDPLKFNDPFESSPNFIRSDVSREYVTELAKMDSIIKEGWRRESPRKYKNYASYKKNWLNNLDKKVDEKMKDISDNLEYVKETFPKTVSDNWRMICFSRSLSSILLWSHYAQEHEGVVIEFDTRDEYLKQIPKNSIMEVIYSREKPIFEPTIEKGKFLDQLRKVIRWKALEWAYEEEQRALLANTALKDDFYDFPSSNPVRAVYIGLRARNETEYEVAKILSEEYYKNTKLFRAVAHKEEYRINFLNRDIG